MNARQFFELARRMRAAQRKYYALPPSSFTKKKEALDESRKLEAQMDAEIKRVSEIIAKREFEARNPIIPGLK